jgi:hypothetical protein
MVGGGGAAEGGPGRVGGRVVPGVGTVGGGIVGSRGPPGMVGGLGGRAGMLRGTGATVLGCVAAGLTPVAAPMPFTAVTGWGERETCAVAAVVEVLCGLL